MSTTRGLEFFDPQTLVDPYAYYETSRDQGPVVDVSTAARDTFLVIGADVIKDVVARPQIFSSRPIGAQGINIYPRAEAYLKEKGFGRTPHLIVMDPPRHTAFRSALGKVLREKRVHQMRPHIRTVATSVIDSFAASGKCEFVHDYAWSLAAQVIADLLGVDHARLEEFKRWSDAWVKPLLQPLTEDEMIHCMDQIAELQLYLVAELEARRAAPRDDLMSDIARATFDLGQGEVPLRAHEQLGMCEVLIVAGNDTTANALSLGMLRLVESPALADRIRGDLKAVERFAEESLRYEGSVQNNFRTVTQDTELGGLYVGAGALVILSWGAANRDPAAWTRPDAFDIDRSSVRSHLAFGGGIHTCAGASLARQELVESYDLLLRRLGNFRLQDDLTPADIRRMGGLVTHGLARLPIRFDVRDPAHEASTHQSNNAIDPPRARP